MKELPKVNRSETPWLIVVMHCPLYSTYVHHYMEGESMRVMFEQYFVQYKVDVVFSGHVHAYERTVSSCQVLHLCHNPKKDCMLKERIFSDSVYQLYSDLGSYFQNQLLRAYVII